ncbi:VOC family protein [Mammaliicoccus sciuri]|uniref:VOC family protein n=1 Tax=Mammaliicoccus sciuri TaxID=1296 RepID=UPI003CC5DE91
MRLTNIRLLTDQYRTMFHFYKENLGIEVVYGNINSNYADFKLGEVYLSLFSKEEMMKALNYKGVAETDSVQQVIVVEVQDLNKYYESFINKVNVVTEPTAREAWGIKCFHILDPDDNILEFYTPL